MTTTNGEAIQNGNGHIDVNGKSQATAAGKAAVISNGHFAEVTPAVWLALRKYLPPRDEDFEYWWQLTGLHLAIMLQAAEYPSERQYNALLFHYHYVVPYLGPRPKPDGTMKWQSLLGVEGSPIEYSWKWNAPGGLPDVRYCMEAIDQYTGSAMDPLNQHAHREMLHHMAEAFPSVNLSWVNHFFATLYDHDPSKYVAEAAAGSHFTTTVMTAPEFLPEGLNVKTYFIPRKIGQTEGQIPLAEWEKSLQLLDPGNKARAAMHEFLSMTAEGQAMSPFMLAVDDVTPEKSRLKFYFQTSHTSFQSVREIMTLGGAIKVPDEKLAELKSLVYAVTDLPEDFPEEDEAPLTQAYAPLAKENFVELPILLAGYIYYFEIAPGQTLPQIKFYTPVRRYGPDDYKLAGGITKWMAAHGRGEYTDRYFNMLNNLSQHRRLQDGKGIQTYVSCLIKRSGSLDITSYLGPEAFDPGRGESSRRRSVRRRGDY
ncbi:dimethylallyl tryptophan synthase 1 [Lecanosticta acicola]|uniref:Dimethylallyl tryptophan synthase 1 n=1 Tax=Lecanosticta acicola TaxID=111012 RepID=A0AAI9EDI9_9PEZI|nr:dimethylallyl tryptophan synthase 1 [Lecanosticta acicola]